jgi:hypothetical protein
MVPTLPLIETLFNETCKTKNTLDHNHILSRDTSDQRHVWYHTQTYMLTFNYFYFYKLLSIYYQYVYVLLSHVLLC